MRPRRIDWVAIITITGTVGLLAASLGGLGWFVWRHHGQKQPPEVGEKGSPAERIKSPPLLPPVGKKSVPLTPIPLPDRQPVEKKPLTFDEAWGEALELAAELDRLEPAITAKKIQILTYQEYVQVYGFLDCEPSAEQHAIGALTKYNLRERLMKLSRLYAQKSDEFKGFAKILWKPRSGPEGLLELMNRWEMSPSYERSLAVEAVRSGRRDPNKLPPWIRKALLDLGGLDWMLGR